MTGHGRMGALLFACMCILRKYMAVAVPDVPNPKYAGGFWNSPNQRHAHTQRKVACRTKPKTKTKDHGDQKQGQGK
jgi:hypothetical protein